MDPRVMEEGRVEYINVTLRATHAIREGQIREGRAHEFDTEVRRGKGDGRASDQREYEVRRKDLCEYIKQLSKGALCTRVTL